MSMELTDVVFVGLGLLVSTIAFFLKKESVRVDNLSAKIREIEIDLAKNDARDCERWTQTTKLLEDRREDVIKIFQELKNK